MSNVLAFKIREDLLGDFLNRYKSESTVRDYKAAVIDFFNSNDFVSLEQIKSVTVDQAEKYLLKYLKKEKYESAKQKRSALKMFWKWAIGVNNLDIANVWDSFIIQDLFRLNVPKCSTEPKGDILNSGEVKDVLDGIRNIRDRVLIRLMVNTGLRREDAAQIRWNHFYQAEIDGQLEWWLKVPRSKGDKYREVFINDKLITEIQQLDCMMRLGQSDFRLFGISGNMINKIVKKYCNINDKNITAHKLRHTTLTHMVLKGANSMQLKQQAGWSSIATADKYIHDIEAKQNSAGKLVDF